jgi:Rieske Fe-S protein
MNWLRRASSEPLWKEEFSVRTADERYVTRRQLTKFLVLTSLGMFVGNLWILFRSLFYKTPTYPQQTVARLGQIPVGGVKLFTYPTGKDHCILVRTAEDEHVAFSQKCTHLSCAVYYSRESNRLECPCHKGFFSIDDGSVLQGPPSRPLPRIVLETRGDELVAVGIKVS